MERGRLKLRVDLHTYDGIIVVHCAGRIIFRDEAAELSTRVTDLLQRTRHLVLELSEVETVDSAGLGQVAVIIMWAQACRCEIRIAAPRKNVRELLELTNLASGFEIHSTVDDALASFRDLVAIEF
jgi:anti-sigma B factor antagonist